MKRVLYLVRAGKGRSFEPPPGAVASSDKVIVIRSDGRFVPVEGGPALDSQQLIAQIFDADAAIVW